MDNIKQTQGPVIGFVMEKETLSGNTRIRNGRPRVKVNFAILLRLRDRDNLGWSRVAQEYRKITGQFVSRDTLERRYKKYKATLSAGKVVINIGPFPLKGNR